MESGDHTLRWAGIILVFGIIVASVFVLTNQPIVGNAVLEPAQATPVVGQGQSCGTVPQSLVDTCSKSCRSTSRCDAYRVACGVPEPFSCICVPC